MRRRPVFSRFYTWLSARAEATEIAAHRDELLEGLAGRVVEIGAGNGMNFAHYPPSVAAVIAIEPEPYLRARAAEAAGAAPVPVRVVGGDAQRLPVADGAADVVVASLVLCSIERPAAALAEARRVVRPDGQLRFYEHVRADGGPLARYQDAADLVWPLLAGGCHTGRNTLATMVDAGFAIDRMRRFDFGSRRLNPAAPHAIGRARPRGG